MELNTATAAAVVALCVLHSLSAEAADCTPVEITAQPQSLALLEGCPATFAVGVTGSGPYFYQWWFNDQSVPDATNSSYTIAIARISDNGAKVRVTITNGCSQTNSTEAVLHILLDVVPPRLLRARGDASLERVIVTFAVGACGWPGLDPFTAQEPFNYSFTGGIIASNALLETNGTNVILTTSRQTPGTVYTLVVNDVADPSGNVISANSETRWQAWMILPGSEPPRIVPPPVSINRSGTATLIGRPPGSQLQQADRITGPWVTVRDPVDPNGLTNSNATRFFRALFCP